MEVHGTCTLYTCTRLQYSKIRNWNKMNETGVKINTIVVGTTGKYNSHEQFSWTGPLLLKKTWRLWKVIKRRVILKYMGRKMPYLEKFHLYDAILYWKARRYLISKGFKRWDVVFGRYFVTAPTFISS